MPPSDSTSANRVADLSEGPAAAQPAAVDLGLKRLIAIFGLFYLVALASYARIIDGQFDISGHPVGRDFINYWSAPVLAYQDRIREVFDPILFHKAQEALVGRTFSFHNWSYPPNLLLILSPLAALPYFTAFAFWTVIGWSLWVWTTLGSQWRSWTGIAFALAPAAAVNAFFGQNGFLTAILFVGGFKLMQTRPMVAGLLFGLLTFKPQLGILIPIALVAAGSYRAITAAVLGAAVMVIASGLVFGWESWIGYFEKIAPFQREVLESGFGTFLWMTTTPFMAIRETGLPIAAAYAVQGLITLAMMILTWRVWRSERPFDLKLAFTTIAAVLATPYALSYDLTICCIGALLFFQQLEKRGFSLPDIFALVSLWTLPLLLPLYNDVLHLVGPAVLAYFCWRVYILRPIASEIDSTIQRPLPPA